MSFRLIATFIVASFALLSAASGATLPYDEAANARTQLQTSRVTAKQQHKHLLVIFGANWCPDCRALDAALQGSVGKLLDAHFVVVKIDVGNFDKNIDLSDRYGTPISKGIPAVVVVGADDKVLYSTKAGELANARRMSETGLYDFFRSVIDRL